MKHKVKHIHFVGIGGSGMSGIAEVLLNLGYRISGSDLPTSATRRLAELGAGARPRRRPHRRRRLRRHLDRGPRRQPRGDRRARRLIPVVPRALMLAELMRSSRASRSPAPTARPPPPAWSPACWPRRPGPDLRDRRAAQQRRRQRQAGQGDYIVVEADESDASFLNLLPVMAVVTNIDADHMETYGHDFARLRQAFVEFTAPAAVLRRGGAVHRRPGTCARSCPFVSKPITSYGLSEARRFRADDPRRRAQMHFTRAAVNGVDAPAARGGAEPAGPAQRAQRAGRDRGGRRARRARRRRSSRRWPSSAASAGASSAMASCRCLPAQGGGASR
jgi:UDP-N-acetylmuramate--alanine ligase